ncbi:putative replication initiation protein [Petrochirus diogenes giant hermit crab associated circular virus]|uniref:putative replication initiation protein n=1 Tax=Petrochirus diogenes giant hermit crab associated circular virus TaxID=1692261 RepID=UPI0006A6AD0F|nr:putative replication initiation protein [Petrochirus diogenes giant hermit crab associated circular virus]AKV62252.1 putative replication initiation protein [Petrochirus diogenes giant hermit crab associated circular virus]
MEGKRVRYRRYCITINNESDNKRILGLFLEDGIKKGVIGVETAPTTGTKHLQGYIEYPTQRDWSSIKKVCPNAHIEAAKGTSRQNYEYCTKEGNFVVHGHFETGKRKRRDYSLSEYVKQVLQDELPNDSTFIRNYEKIQTHAKLVSSRQEKVRLFGELSCCKVTSWQRKAIESLFLQGKREVLWIYESVGGKGKTFLATILEVVYGFTRFDGITKSRDIALLIPPIPKGFVFDVTRDDASNFSYNTLEQVKNGYVMSGKYGGSQHLFRPVPVIVLSNFEPIRSSLSEDRWKVWNIENASNEKKEDLPEEGKIPPKAVLFEEEENKENQPNAEASNSQQSNKDVEQHREK